MARGRELLSHDVYSLVTVDPGGLVLRFDEGGMVESGTGWWDQTVEH